MTRKSWRQRGRLMGIGRRAGDKAFAKVLTEAGLLPAEE
jgi:hypothetical protein